MPKGDPMPRRIIAMAVVTLLLGCVTIVEAALKTAVIDVQGMICSG